MSYNFKETENKSCLRISYHVYLSMYIIDFKKLLKIDQLRLVKVSNWIEEDNKKGLISDGGDSSVSTYASANCYKEP